MRMAVKKQKEISEAVCERCIFFVREIVEEEEDPNYGNCHRFPPSNRFETEDGELFWLFPEVETWKWCGEFLPSEDKA